MSYWSNYSSPATGWGAWTQGRPNVNPWEDSFAGYEKPNWQDWDEQGQGLWQAFKAHMGEQLAPQYWSPAKRAQEYYYGPREQKLKDAMGHKKYYALLSSPGGRSMLNMFHGPAGSNKWNSANTQMIMNRYTLPLNMMYQAKGQDLRTHGSSWGSQNYLQREWQKYLDQHGGGWTEPTQAQVGPRSPQNPYVGPNTQMAPGNQTKTTTTKPKTKSTSGNVSSFGGSSPVTNDPSTEGLDTYLNQAGYGQGEGVSSYL